VIHIASFSMAISSPTPPEISRNRILTSLAVKKLIFYRPTLNIVEPFFD